MTQTQHLQRVLLMMAKELDALCRRHDIDYYLLGGSSLGARRHKGFIPWDDDFDIVMSPDNYRRFLDICRAELPAEKYFVQEGVKDWPEDFSKIKLRGTRIDEVGGFEQQDGENGIYIDVFRLDNGADSRAGQLWQYFCGKFWLAYCMSRKGYKAEGFAKRAMTAMSQIMRLKSVEKFFYGQYIKFNRRPTRHYSEIMGRARLHNSFTPAEVYGRPVRVPFEDTEFPVQAMHDDYLTRIFGDYMQLPPEDKRCGIHTLSIDFGKY